MTEKTTSTQELRHILSIPVLNVTGVLGEIEKKTFLMGVDFIPSRISGLIEQSWGLRFIGAPSKIREIENFLTHEVPVLIQELKNSTFSLKKFKKDAE